MICNTCFRHCNIPEGGLGFCGARTCKDGEVIAANYGRVTSLALDPIEKKPLARFHPGSYIVSAGSYGCNLRCPFCQNYQISWSEEAYRLAKTAEYISPEELAGIAAQTRNRGNIGVAFTYNEPLIGWEYIRDTAKLVHEEGMKSVIVSNGTASLEVLSELTPYIDAMNIDLKGFTDHYYNEVLGGNRAMTMAFIEEAVKYCHVELTTLIVPGENDSEDEIREMCSWIASLTTNSGTGKDIPLHISRFFPRFNMQDRRATDVGLIYRTDRKREQTLRKLTKKDILAAFKTSSPIIVTFLVLGSGYGLLMQSHGYGPFWSLISGIIIFSGTAQFVSVTMLTGGSILMAGLTSLMISVRHIFFSISMIGRYNNEGRRKPYLYYALCDETYAMLSKDDGPEGVNVSNYRLLVTLFDQSAWVIGSVLGGWIGTLLTFDSTGIDFAMTALFTTVFIQQWIDNKQHLPAILGVAATLACRLIFGSDIFLIPAMIIIIGVLTAARSRIEPPATETAGGDAND